MRRNFLWGCAFVLFFFCGRLSVLAAGFHAVGMTQTVSETYSPRGARLMVSTLEGQFKANVSNMSVTLVPRIHSLRRDWLETGGTESGVQYGLEGYVVFPQSVWMLSYDRASAIFAPSRYAVDLSHTVLSGVMMVVGLQHAWEQISLTWGVEWYVGAYFMRTMYRGLMQNHRLFSAGDFLGRYYFTDIGYVQGRVVWGVTPEDVYVFDRHEGSLHADLSIKYPFGNVSILGSFFLQHRLGGNVLGSGGAFGLQWML